MLIKSKDLNSKAAASNYNTMDRAHYNANRYVVKGHLHVITHMSRTAKACVILAQTKYAHQKYTSCGQLADKVL